MAKSVPLVALLGIAVAAGGASGLAVGLLVQERPEVGGPTLAAPGTDRTTSRRVDELAEENATLRERVAFLESRPAAPGRAPAREPADGFVAQAEFDAFREEVLGALERRPAPDVATAVALGESLDPETKGALKTRVADVLQEVRHEEAVEGMRKFHDARRERIEGDLEKLGSWLVLEPYQTDELRVALTRQYDREDELRVLWADGEPRENLAELKQRGHEDFRADLEVFLGADQLETFWSKVMDGGSEGK